MTQAPSWNASQAFAACRCALHAGSKPELYRRLRTCMYNVPIVIARKGASDNYYATRFTEPNSNYVQLFFRYYASSFHPR